jgi:hypothetical protein
MKYDKKIDQFINKQLVNDELKEVVIMRTLDGGYELFQKYKISKTPTGYLVTFLTPIDRSYEFTTLKNATAWCTFDNARQYRDANRVIDLDLRLSSNELDMQIHKKLAKKAKDKGSKLIYTIKWEEDARKKKLLSEELDSFINSSRILQERKFNKTPGFKKL